MIKREEQLEQVAEWYLEADGHLDGWRDLHSRLVQYRFRSLQDLVADHEVLELGMADGQMTRCFLEACTRVVCVDGAPAFIDKARREFAPELSCGKLELVHSLFEDYKPERKFPVVVAGLILEHLPRPVEMLRAFRRLVAPGGRLLVSVPNAHSLHRLVAVKMGLLGTPDELNEQDRRLGHCRCYTPELLSEHIAAAGMRVVELRGILLKPLANRQIDGVWTPEMLDGFYELGRDLPHLCAEILAVCDPAE